MKQPIILHFTDTNINNAPTVVLLHGMACSSRYWQSVIATSSQNLRFIAIDLLGFGQSPKPHDLTYDYQTHIETILATLEKANVTGPFILVGHSMGALIALRLATLHPKLIDRLILCGLPFYPTKAIARKEIVNSKRLWQLIYYGPTSHGLCLLWCTCLRPITRHLAPFYLPYLPKHVAQDTLLHTWQAFSQSLRYVIEEQDVQADIKKLQMPAVMLYGSDDKSTKYVREERLDDLKNTKIGIYDGLSHQLPLENPHLIADLLY